MNRREEYFERRDHAFRGQHQPYFLEMRSVPSSATADVFSIEGEEAIGRESRYTIQFTHTSHDLSQREYLGKRGSLLIQPPRRLRPEPPRHKYGVVTGFSKLSTSKSQSVYEVVLESRLALLRNTPKVRFFFDKSEPEIMQQLLQEHGFNKIWARVDMKLYRTYQKRRIVTQWQESDLAFLKRMCERTGIWFVCEEGEDCEVVRFGDDFTHYRRDAARDNRAFGLPFRPEAGMDTHGAESVKSLEMHAVSIPAAYHVRSYNYRQAPYPIEATEQIRAKTDDTSTYGEASTASLAIETKEDAQREALLRREAAEAAQIEYRGTGDSLDATPGTVIAFTNHTLADAKYGLLIVSMKCSASRTQGYKVEFTAIPSDRLYRMPLRESEWPRIEGTITGTIASTEGYSGPYIDPHGEYIVQFHDDREKRVAGLNSCLLRLGKPFAGKWQSGFHMPYIPGTEVAVAFFAGNPDLPYILHALHNSQDTDPVHQQHKWRTRNVVIHTIRNNTIQVEDRENQEHIKIATEPGKSQLNLGHAVNNGDQLRGLGFELRSDAKGAVRAGQGLLISAEAQSKAQGQITDTAGATALFERTQAQADALAQGAVASKAEVADLKAENQWLRDELADIKKQVIALSAPHGIGLATPDRVMIGAGKDVSVATSRGFNVSAFKNVTIAAREVLSLFANTMGIRMFAGKGPIEIQAQSDVLALAAQKDVIVTSANGAVHVRADKELVLECGGAYVELKDGAITLGSAKPLQLKLPGMKKGAPEVLYLSGPAFSPTVVPFRTSCNAWLSGNPRPEQVSPSAEEVGLEGFANAPVATPKPISKVSSRRSTPIEQIEQPPISGNSPNHPNADHDSAHEPKSPIQNDPLPLKLDSPVFCDGQFEDMTGQFDGTFDSAPYEKLDASKQPILDDLGSPTITGYPKATSFSLHFDAAKRTLYASVHIKVTPVELIKVDATGKPVISTSGQKEVVHYDCMLHYYGVRAGAGKIFNNNLVMQHRSAVPPAFLAAKKQEIEATLNRHRSILILNGCSKHAACGCRVAVEFKVDLMVNLFDNNAGNDANTVRLFTTATRADSTSWGEKNMKSDSSVPGTFVEAARDSVIAHECGHNFNFVDEYWAEGGIVHKRYIKNGQIDFATGASFAGQQVWQLESSATLMGGGAWTSNPTIPPYHLEYIARKFSELSQKDWRIGYV
ncbi:type VI secretion system Vgr family protein [Caballeronia sp. LP003]|uniref:type VI secretion system Vgr family protein n=1 Tax=Caballeronia sp. LP003 TaxID=3038551 RepID=UPI0028575C7D|nr:type VI secretion system Vgr family protein [Caballeronia sp. LP003]MDR5785862.1 type VI secretion system Vgr family protein [Caballeronia sp. LP003]